MKTADLGQFKQAGFFRMCVPRSHGGYALDLRTGCDVLETLARADGATGWTTMIGMETPHLLSLLPRERFDAIYSSGPDVIAGGAFNPQGQAVLESVACSSGPMRCASLIAGTRSD